MPRPRFKGRKVIEDYWVDNYCTVACTLCGNRGIIDTRNTAVTAAGVRTGRLNWCICPNGIVLRAIHKGELPNDIIPR